MSKGSLRHRDHRVLIFLLADFVDHSPQWRFFNHLRFLQAHVTQEGHFLIGILVAHPRLFHFHLLTYPIDRSRIAAPRTHLLPSGITFKKPTLPTHNSVLPPHASVPTEPTSGSSLTATPAQDPMPSPSPSFVSFH